MLSAFPCRRSADVGASWWSLHLSHCYSIIKRGPMWWVMVTSIHPVPHTTPFIISLIIFYIAHARIIKYLPMPPRPLFTNYYAIMRIFRPQSACYWGRISRMERFAILILVPQVWLEVLQLYWVHSFALLLHRYHRPTPGPKYNDDNIDLLYSDFIKWGMYVQWNLLFCLLWTNRGKFAMLSRT